MKTSFKRQLSWLLVIATVCTVLFSALLPASAAGTGYTKAEDVQYVVNSGKIANWGVRGEACRFLSTKAVEFYTGSYTFDSLSKKAGGTEQSNAQYSVLYSELKSLMTSKHTHETDYGETRDLYKYTDCMANDTTKISSFYSGKTLNSTWDGGSTWNREHTWPNSKGLGGNDEDDIMMLRPTSVSENSSRGNTAYGESSGYYNPGNSVKGDCARIVLYTYTRWGNTGAMWGKSGVIENLDILLKWMAEDPVDTWEMGRNDAVQSITGTRNVFIDYPEYAYLLFGREIPSNLSSPSNGKANASPVAPDGSLTAPPPADLPTPSGNRVTYTFEDYPSGVQYAKDEVHQLDTVLTVTTTDCHFREELRLYYSTNTTYGVRNGTAIFASTRVIESLSLNAGNKNATLKVSGSLDGQSWTPIKDLSVQSAYADYDVAIENSEYKFIKLEAVGAQLRVKTITMNYAEAPVENTTLPTDSSSDTDIPSDTDVNTPNTTEPDSKTDATTAAPSGSGCGSFAGSGVIIMISIVTLAGFAVIKKK